MKTKSSISNGAKRASTARPAIGFISISTPAKNRRVILAVRYGSRIHPLGFKVSHQKTDDDVFRSVDEGGWMIPYENEDPEISRRYQAALKANGVIF